MEPLQLLDDLPVKVGVAEPKTMSCTGPIAIMAPFCLIRRTSHGRRFPESRQLAQTLLSLHYNPVPGRASSPRWDERCGLPHGRSWPSLAEWG